MVLKFHERICFWTLNVYDCNGNSMALKLFCRREIGIAMAATWHIIPWNEHREATSCHPLFTLVPESGEILLLMEQLLGCGSSLCVYPKKLDFRFGDRTNASVSYWSFDYLLLFLLAVEEANSQCSTACLWSRVYFLILLNAVTASCMLTGEAKTSDDSYPVACFCDLKWALGVAILNTMLIVYDWRVLPFQSNYKATVGAVLWH